MAKTIYNLRDIYYMFALSHGAGRTLYYTKGAHVSEYDNKDKPIKRPILITEQVQLAVINAFTNIMFSPITILDDVATFEMYMRGSPRYRTSFIFPLHIRYEE